jgi:hypothetical protein
LFGAELSFNLPQKIDSGHEEPEEGHEEVLLVRRRRWVGDVIVGLEYAAHSPGVGNPGPAFSYSPTSVLKEAFNFSDGEEKFIVNARTGQGILVTQEGRLPFYNLLSDEEKRLFTTKPKEVSA